MKCKKCNELRKKKVNEARKKAIVRSYIKDWRKVLLITILSVSIFAILAFVATVEIALLPNYFRLSLLIIILMAWFFMFLTWAKIKPGLLSFAGLMLVIAPILEFKDPVTPVVFFCLSISLLMLLLDVGLGVIFKIKVTPVERPWCLNREVRNSKLKRGKE